MLNKIANPSGFNISISCNTCGSKKVEGEYCSGNISLKCKDCEALKDLKDKNDKIGRSLLLGQNNHVLVSVLSDIIYNNKKAVSILEKISKHLKEGVDLFGEGECFLHSGFLFKQEIFELCSQLEGLTIINYFSHSVEDKMISVSFLTFKGLNAGVYRRGGEVKKIHNMECKILELKIDKRKDFNIKVVDDGVYQKCNILWHPDILSFIESYLETYELAKQYISTSK